MDIDYATLFPYLMKEARKAFDDDRKKPEPIPPKKALEVFSDRIGGLPVLLNSNSETVLKLRTQEFIDAIPVPENADTTTLAAIKQEALEMLLSFRPNDPMERMLAANIVATHHATMRCFRDAGDPTASLQARDMNLRHAVRLSALLEKQHAALLRSKAKHPIAERDETVVDADAISLVLKLFTMAEEDLEKKSNA